MHLQAEASSLEAEAATWKLLLHMYARTNKTYPGGGGGQQTSVPTVRFVIQCTVLPHSTALQTFTVAAAVAACMSSPSHSSLLHIHGQTLCNTLQTSCAGDEHPTSVLMVQGILCIHNKLTLQWVPCRCQGTVVCQTRTLKWQELS